jgi:SAM-dependent methyltransferase
MTGMAFFRDKYMDKDKILKVADIGGLDINGSFRDLMISNLWIYHGIDVQEGRNVDFVLSDTDNWKELEMESYDIVISGSTFEHIEHPWVAIKELARILRPGGYCCIIAPMICPEHKFPVDCWRFMADGWWSLAKWANLEVLEVMESHDRTQFLTDTMLIARKPNAVV